MQLPLVLTTMLMGLAGGPHCIAMCGAACASFQQTSIKGWQIWQFHAGRVFWLRSTWRSSGGLNQWLGLVF